MKMLIRFLVPFVLFLSVSLEGVPTHLRNFNEVLKDASLWAQHDKIRSEVGPLGNGDPEFLYGVATCTYQDSGAHHCPKSQWAEWEGREVAPDNLSGSSVNLFALYRDKPMEVVKRLKKLSVNTYRFSIEWSQIEPEHGVFNEEALGVYIALCKVLRDNGIQPLVTLHHFSEPYWFHKIGSFWRGRNVGYYVDFCMRVFPELIQEYKGKPLVELFCTINEPGVEAMCRYVLGLFPPNHKLDFKRAGRFLLHMLLAHGAVYDELHAIAAKKGAQGIKIGICHQYLTMHATSALTKPVASAINQWNKSFLEYFATGRYSCHLPLLCSVNKDLSHKGKPKTDFIGLQYYGRVYVGLKGVEPMGKPATTMEGMHEDPEGLYEAILAVHKACDAPVLVTENGISTDSDEQRGRYLARALYAAERARQVVGAKNMMGYIMWSFTDNYEWFHGWPPKFGAFALNKKGQLEKKYKPGIQPFVDTVKAWKASVKEEALERR